MVRLYVRANGFRFAHLVPVLGKKGEGIGDDESLRHIGRPHGLVSEPRGDLTCRGVEGP